MLYTDRHRLGRIIIEVALSDRSQSSDAVYHSVLALASYHRGDPPMQVDRYKRAALKNLYLHLDPDVCEATEHVAANLILCVLEMQQTSGKNSAWVGYISGVKQVIDAFKSHQASSHSRASVILGWVYYFDVMARFSFRHWRTEQIRAVANELGFSPDGSQTCALQYLLARASFAQGVPNIAAHAHPVVELLAEVTYTAMYSSEPGYLSGEYQSHLENLRLRLEDVSSKLSEVQDFAQEEVNSGETLLELARLAGLIYLERVSRNLSGPSAKIESWTRRALSILSGLDSCPCPMALFFIGCEAVRDEDRMIILNIYAKMEARPHLRHSLEVRSLIQTAWNQQDLAEDGALDYVHKLNLVMSCRDVVPRLM
ncbi:fungal-specific transcription factor domain-containing protein [Phaeosphaeria sp. MPI-PUGE-AT-0046c]|nr:fungal-specific transcription factor domain-containing protein [Phaeosphaeria sp. MPI-PUGE-AT-0046c]